MTGSNRLLIERFYAAFAARDGAAMAACYGRDASFDDPVFRGLRGREAGAMWMYLTGRSSDLRVDLLERRVRRLVGEDAAVGTHVTRRSLGAAGAVLVAVWISGLVMAHPLPAATVSDAGMQGHATTHCRHAGESPFSHLFCLGWHAHPAGAPCPHTGR